MQSFVLGLTVFRILASPSILILIIYLDYPLLAFWLFNVAALTDYFDGKLARHHKVESQLGAILDPIADKLLTLFGIISVMLFVQDNIVSLMGAIILAREFWVSALREYSRANNISSATSVSFVAKSKTALQFIAISMYLIGISLNYALIMFLANYVLLVSLILGIKSAIDYTANVFR